MGDSSIKGAKHNFSTIEISVVRSKLGIRKLLFLSQTCQIGFQIKGRRSVRTFRATIWQLKGQGQVMLKVRPYPRFPRNPPNFFGSGSTSTSFSSESYITSRLPPSTSSPTSSLSAATFLSAPSASSSLDSSSEMTAVRRFFVRIFFCFFDSASSFSAENENRQI